MAKLYKIEMYITDFGEVFEDKNEIVNSFERGEDIFINIANSQVVDIDYDEDMDINQNDCPIEAYGEYFK